MLQTIHMHKIAMFRIKGKKKEDAKWKQLFYEDNLNIDSYTKKLVILSKHKHKDLQIYICSFL